MSDGESGASCGRHPRPNFELHTPGVLESRNYTGFELRKVTSTATQYRKPSGATQTNRNAFPQQLSERRYKSGGFAMSATERMAACNDAVVSVKAKTNHSKHASRVTKCNDAIVEAMYQDRKSRRK